MRNRAKVCKLFVCFTVFVVTMFFWISESLSGSTVKEKFVIAPHPVLRQKAVLIDREDHETIQLLIEMADYLDNSVRPIAGISLPQVAVSQRGFVIMINDEPVIMINPLITKLGQEVPSLEGCLSLPNQFGYVKRYSSVIVEYHDEDWEKQTLRLEELYAFVVQHEFDHLEGILFTDKLLAEAPERLRGSDIPLE